MINQIVKLYANSRLHIALNKIREGWQNYSFLFYIGSIGAILGKEWGIAGGGATALGLIFFYYIGDFHKKVEKNGKQG
jgi:hypothetical protein